MTVNTVLNNYYVLIPIGVDVREYAFTLPYRRDFLKVYAYTGVNIPGSHRGAEITSGFRISPQAGGDSGTLILDDIPRAGTDFVPGEFVVLELDPDFRQSTEFDQTERLDVTGLEAQFDRLTIQAQFLRVLISRASTLNEGYQQSINGLLSSVVDLRNADNGFSQSIVDLESSNTALMASDATLVQDVETLRAADTTFAARVSVIDTELEQIRQMIAGLGGGSQTLSYSRTLLGGWDAPPTTATWTELTLSEMVRESVAGAGDSDLIAGDKLIIELKGPLAQGQNQTYRIDKERLDDMDPANGPGGGYGPNEHPDTTEAFKVHFGLAGHRSVKVQVSPTDSHTIAIWVSANFNLASRVRVYRGRWTLS